MHICPEELDEWVVLVVAALVPSHGLQVLKVQVRQAAHEQLELVGPEQAESRAATDLYITSDVEITGG